MTPWEGELHLRITLCGMVECVLELCAAVVDFKGKHRCDVNRVARRGKLAGLWKTLPVAPQCLRTS